MFFFLLLITLLIAGSVSAFVAWLFNEPVCKILHRIFADDISLEWVRYLHFAIIVVGISSGVRIYELERYITPSSGNQNSQILQLTSERLVLDIYRTVIGSLQGIAWLLLVFFVFALIAFVIVRVAEMKRTPMS